MTLKETVASTIEGRDTMEMQKFINDRVKKYYWDDDLNCAITTLKILSEHFGVNLSEQVLDSALGMHGAGEYGAQCGLVEGTLLFIGIWGRIQKIQDAAIVETCHRYAQRFERRFSSLTCRVLRPEGFHNDNPPHLCEGLTCEAVRFNLEFVRDAFS